MYRIEDLPEKIASRLTTDPESGCWLWSGSKNREGGYGHVRWQGKLSYVHRVVYELLVGPIPEGHTIDHVRAKGCVHTHCAWPEHLDPVTQLENNRRIVRTPRRHTKDQCPQGHAYSEENTYLDSRGYRQCRTCRRDKNRDRSRRARAQRA